MANLASSLDTRLNAEMAKVIRTAEHVANIEKVKIYIVGGLIRDLLLGVEPRDLDILVVGDGETFAKKMADMCYGEMVAKSQFGTFIVKSPSLQFDIVTARSETYPRPGALPIVKPDSLIPDLQRRDFTVGAMAIAITSDDWGTLYDPLGGFADCARKKLRLIHDKSIQDDPTRALRAARYMGRLDFKLTAETDRILRRDVHYINAISAKRIRSELVKMMMEPKSTEILQAAESIDVFAAISSSLRVGRAALRAFTQAPADSKITYYIACLGAGLTRTEAEAVSLRLDMPAYWHTVLIGSSRYRTMSYLLERADMKPSEITLLLEEFPLEVLEVSLSIASPTIQKRWLGSYLREYRHIKPELTGEDIIATGILEGKQIGELLRDLKAARLDRRVNTREEEIAFIKHRARISGFIQSAL